MAGQEAHGGLASSQQAAPQPPSSPAQSPAQRPASAEQLLARAWPHRASTPGDSRVTARQGTGGAAAVLPCAHARCHQGHAGHVCLLATRRGNPLSCPRGWRPEFLAEQEGSHVVSMPMN